VREREWNCFTLKSGNITNMKGCDRFQWFNKAEFCNKVKATLISKFF
jgi:hypothetical protein